MAQETPGMGSQLRAALGTKRSHLGTLVGPSTVVSTTGHTCMWLPWGSFQCHPPLRECKSHGQLGAPGLSPANTQRPAHSHTPKAGRGHSGDGDQSEQLCGLTLKFGRRHGQCPLPDGFQHHLAGERRGKTIFQEKIPAAINTNTPVGAYKLHADTHVT